MAALASQTPPPGVPAKVTTIPPNQTLYLTNLPSAKIHKADLRTALYLLFSTYGPVLDVVALKTGKMRGQAHIVYRDVTTATQAMRALAGFQFLGREMKISYAKSKSNTIAKLDGTFRLATASRAAAVEVSNLQDGIFNNTPAARGSSTTTTATAPPSISTSAQPVTKAPPGGDGDHEMKDAGAAADGRGQKRTRDEEEEADSDGDVAMEEDSDED